MPTVFTRIARGELPAAIVDEAPLAFAFMDAGQVNPGHVIVATRREAVTLMDLSDDEAAAVFRMAARVARRVQAAFSPAGITVLQANGAAGFQTVPHFHLHVLPRHPDDGVALSWPRKDPPMARLQALAARIRAADGAGRDSEGEAGAAPP